MILQSLPVKRFSLREPSFSEELGNCHSVSEDKFQGIKGTKDPVSCLGKDTRSLVPQIFCFANRGAVLGGSTARINILTLRQRAFTANRGQVRLHVSAIIILLIIITWQVPRQYNQEVGLIKAYHDSVIHWLIALTPWTGQGLEALFNGANCSVILLNAHTAKRHSVF